VFGKGQDEHRGAMIIPSQLEGHKNGVVKDRGSGSICHFARVTQTHRLLICVEKYGEKPCLELAVR